MGSMDTPTLSQNGSESTVAADGPTPPVSDSATMPTEKTMESELSRKRRFGMLPLEVGTRVMCRWRDGKYHPVKVIERRKIHVDGVSDYEYYVHYTECKISYLFLSVSFAFTFRVRVYI